MTSRTCRVGRLHGRLSNPGRWPGFVRSPLEVTKWQVHRSSETRVAKAGRSACREASVRRPGPRAFGTSREGSKAVPPSPPYTRRATKQQRRMSEKWQEPRRSARSAGLLCFRPRGERGSKTVCRSGSATSRRAAGCSAVAAVQAFPAALQRRNIDTIARSRNEARELQSVRDWPTKAGMQLAMRPRSAVAANVGSSMR